MCTMKSSIIMLIALSLTALLSGCGSARKDNSPGGVARVADEAVCRGCHAAAVDPISGTAIVADYLTSSHNIDSSGCEGCHGGGVNHPGVVLLPFPNPLVADRCIACHTTNGLAPTSKDLTPLFERAKAGFVSNGCANCHTSSKVGSIHGAHATSTEDCVSCHSVAAPQHGIDRVNDNNGVRAITAEFSKWSHHVTGVTLNSAHCAACHLEGTVVDGKIVIDKTKHMADAKIHLRSTTGNADNDFAWDPAAPDHSGMDTFCMSCHDANGATSPMSVKIQKFINDNGLAPAGKAASASNPFGDTISNRYDKMQRPAVINVDGQFDITNNSHHAVKGKRYSGRTRIEATRRINDVDGFANNSTATLFGARMTIYDAGTQDGRAAFNALYSPLGTAVPPTAATSLGDDSTLHCGDCHTVGQWKAGVATNAAGVLNTAVIGAHGSNNEYLLRNDKGTDARHTQDAYTITAGVVTFTNPNAANLVCFNCHSFSRYGSVFNATGTTGPHVGETDSSGRCNGVANTIPFNGYTTGTATDGTQFMSRFMGPRTIMGGTPAFAPGFLLPTGAGQVPATGEQEPDFGNVFGIQCANCHNSGAGNAYGGIHGSKNNQTLAGYTNDPSVTGGSYIDAMGNTTKIMRFLPGLGDAMHVPGTLGGMVPGKGGTTVKFIQYSGMTSVFNVYSATSATNRTKRYSATRFFELPVRDNRPAALAGNNNKKVGSYNFQTGGVTSDSNWEQKGWKQSGPNSTLDTNQQQVTGAGCYTLGSSADRTPGTITTGVGKLDNNGAIIVQRPNVMDDLRGPSQGVAGQPNPELWENWGGCDDHGAPIGGANHGFIKRIVRPVTY